MWVCMDTLRTQASLCVCTQADATRIDGCTWINRHLFTYIYIYVRVDIRLYLDTRTSERRRGARVGVRLMRARARVRPRGGTSASACNRRSECTGVSITRMRVCVRAMRGLRWMSSARSTRPPIVARRARAASARGARQDHRLHEGEGAPRLARKVHELGVPVRPAPPSRRLARSRRCRRCAAPRALPRRVLGRTTRRWRCGGGGVAGRRPRRAPRAHGWRARPTGARPGRAGAARRGGTGGAQGGKRHRARSAAGGGRLAFPEEIVSAPAAALTRPRRCADAWRAVSGARTRRARLGTCVSAYVCVRSSECMCVQT